MSIDVLRLIVVVLALAVAGSTIVIAGRYLVSSIRLGRSPGRILARHVAEVAAGTAGLSIGYATGIYGQLGGVDLLPASGRLSLYLASMLLLLIGVIEVSVYQGQRATRYPQRQEQVRSAVRAAIDRQRVTGPRSADIAAVKATNAVLELEGTPPLPVPDEPSQPDPDTRGSGTGRHALRKDRRTP